MGLISTIQNKTEQARAKERIKPLLESRMMRDILLEVGQRGTEKLDPQSVPLEQRPRAAKLAAENGTAGLLQSVISEVVLDEKGITLHAGNDEVTFLYGDYNYEDIDDTDCLPAVAQFWCSTCGDTITSAARSTRCPSTTAGPSPKRPARSSSAATTRIPPLTPPRRRSSGCSD